MRVLYRECLLTRSTDVRDELAEGFEPSPLPPVGPDGALELPKLRVFREPPPRLCEAGPCHHYHRFEIQLDAQAPQGARLLEGGKIEPLRDGSGAAVPMPGVLHTEVHHYCYPTAGVETILGDLPVTSCNRWSPKLPVEIATEQAVQDAFMRSATGQGYQAELDAWAARQQADQKEFDDALGDVEIDIPDPDPPVWVDLETPASGDPTP